MLLYHGTSEKWLNNILKRGIEPRGMRQSRNNWKHVPHSSNPKCVYLTDSYAPYFAFNTTNIDGSCAVIEVDTDLLTEINMFPDEDFLEQSSRGIETPIPGTMSQRTLHYRKLQFTYDYPCQDPRTLEWITWWKASLQFLGTCSYRGTIPLEAITRVVTWPHKPNIGLMFIWDPTITIINQRILGDRYRILTKKLFAGDFIDPATASEEEVIQSRLDENPLIPIIKDWKLIELNSY